MRLTGVTLHSDNDESDPFSFVKIVHFFYD